jgi:hypothetical protein
MDQVRMNMNLIGQHGHRRCTERTPPPFNLEIREIIHTVSLATDVIQIVIAADGNTFLLCLNPT